MAAIELTLKQHDKIAKAIKALNDVRKEIQAKNPDKNINWYLEDSNNLNLMEDNSHDEDGKENKDAIIQSFFLVNSSGGGW